MATLTRTHKKRTLIEKRRDVAFLALEQWRKRNAKALKNFDPVVAVRKSRASR